MIRLVAGLGNPGRQYEKTRHNVGFWLVDRFAKRANGHWQHEPKFKGMVAEVQLFGQKIYLLKPETYMNLSGNSVAALSRYYGLKVEEILVVHDELDLDAGVVRMKEGGGHAGHNGLRSIIACGISNDFLRIRIGIARPLNRQSVADYVLSPPGVEECEKLEASIERILQNIDSLMMGEKQMFMRAVHGN